MRFARMLLLATLLALCSPTPTIAAQDTSGTAPPDSLVVAEPVPHAGPDSTATDSASAPPVTVPRPSEPGLKGWLQALMNEYAGQLLVVLSSLTALMFARWFPAYARFDTVLKALATFAGAMALYSLMRWIGGTVPDDVMRIVVDGLGPVIAAVAAAFGAGNMAKKTKAISAEARGLSYIPRRP